MKKAYQNEYQKAFKLSYSKVSIYIPKKNGKPCIDKGCRWYVYFYFKDKTGQRKQFKEYQGINRLKTVKERMQASKVLQKAIESFLYAGGNPFEFQKQDYTVLQAVDLAFNEKKKIWKPTSLRSASNYYKRFTGWLLNNNIDNLPVKQFKKQYIIHYLSELKNDLSNISVNNHKRFLHNIFKKLSELAIIEINPVADIPNLRENPTKNKTFAPVLLKDMFAYLQANEPILFEYVQFMIYTFMRPVEIVRLRVGNVDLEKNLIYSETKTGKAIIPVIEKLRPILQKKQLQNYGKDDILFTNLGVPYGWDLSATEESRYIFFKEKFFDVKKHFNLGPEYGLYSFRHTFAKMLYNKFLADGLTDLQAKHKLMTITRHKSISSLNKYLRGIGAFVPDDYSDDFTFDF